ncbi:MAG TPA: DNA methyltransferase [Thermoplasmata archaeon]|nr:DNA methyltransferase [Thermoplasmata archaeon]
MRSADEEFPVALRAVLSDTGAIGATVRQIASRLDDTPLRVEAALARLRRDGEVLRMGRGLWLLCDFEHLESREDFADPVEFVDRFRKENGIELDRYSGPITFRSNEATPVHRWWPYVQGYSAEFVAGVLSREGLAPGATVLDPFAGSGTTLVETRRAGLRALGFELLPPAALAARVKTNFDLDPGALGDVGQAIADHARRGRPGPLPFLRETRRQFAPKVLNDLARLRDALPPEGNPTADAARLAFGRILIPASRLHRSPCLGYSRSQDPDGPSPLERFRASIRVMQADLEHLARERDRWGPPARVETRDVRAGGAPPRSVDMAVTSPPYVNGMDYVMNYKIDLAWLGYARSYADLRALRAAEVACDNLPRSETAGFLALRKLPDPWLPEILRRMRQNVARKGSYRRDDMHAIVHRYFADLARVLVRVREALKPGGRFVLVVGDSLLAGVYVPGDLILARIGEKVGFSIDSVEVARSRRSGQRRSFALRESIVTLRRPRPGSGRPARKR